MKFNYQRVNTISEALEVLTGNNETRKILAALTPREEKVLRMRFGISEKSDLKLTLKGDEAEVSDTLKRAGQIENNVLKKMCGASRRREIKGGIK
jgi:RNA polymerase primary sigma factor